MRYKPKETPIYALYNASKTINILQYILTKKIQKKLQKNSRKGRLLSAVLFRGGRGTGWVYCFKSRFCHFLSIKPLSLQKRIFDHLNKNKALKRLI